MFIASDPPAKSFLYSFFYPASQVECFFPHGDPTLYLPDASPMPCLLVNRICVLPSLDCALLILYSPQYLEHPQYSFN